MCFEELQNVFFLQLDWVESKAELEKQPADTRQRNEKIRRDEALWFWRNRGKIRLPLSLQPTNRMLHTVPSNKAVPQNSRNTCFYLLTLSAPSVFSIPNHLWIAAAVHSCSTTWGVWGVFASSFALRWWGETFLDEPTFFSQTSVIERIEPQVVPDTLTKQQRFIPMHVGLVWCNSCWHITCFND